LGGGVGVNFLGSVNSTNDVGGIAEESKLSHGLGYYVCGDSTLQNGNGLIERSIQGGTGFDEVYYANKGAIIRGNDITQGLTGPNHFIGATAFAEFTGTYNGVQITEDVSNVKSGAV
ncbi:unnamed protein product, partial [Scytosiphon promiscuus]